MEEMKFIVAVDVPYEVEITAKGIPMHEAKVEFCIHKRDVSFNFPAKRVDDNKFIFIITNVIKDLVNNTHDYKLFLYYGNARFEADSGSFNLVDKTAFNVKMLGNQGGESLASKLQKKTQSSKSRTKKEVNKPTAVEKKETEVVKHQTTKKELKVEATKPTPTPIVETTTTLKEAKAALKKSKNHIIEENKDDPNQKVKDILSFMEKEVTPIVVTPNTLIEVTEPQSTGTFFSEVHNMRKLNESRRKNKKVRDAIRLTTKKKK